MNGRPWTRQDAARITTLRASAASWEEYCWGLQAALCAQAEALEGEGPGGAAFARDPWERGESARGLTRVLQGGRVLEKAAVNVSVVEGRLTAARAEAMRQRRGEGSCAVEEGAAYAAAAVSIVFHARNPHVPTLRGDVRRMALLDERGGVRSEWFGGGADLTPAYLEEGDCREFHRFWSDACGAHGGPELYPALKRQCDDYFYIPARREHRGVGGVFFDDLEPGAPAAGSAGPAPDDPEAFARAVGAGLVDSWEGIARRRAATPFGERERHWQCLRRGRYVEFNLLYDRGVRFGLDGGRIESIMVSAPPQVAWDYMAEVRPGSPEEAVTQVLQNPRDWA